MKSYKIYLIRHGVTAANMEARFVGRTDIPLSDTGRTELARLKEKFEYPRAEAFFSSPLRRCTETLSILYPDARPILIDGLREYDFGDFENRTADELASHPLFRDWTEGKADAPGGETSAQLARRTGDAFRGIVEALMRTGITTAAVCAHGGTLMTILSAFGLPRYPFGRWMVKNGCGYEIRVTPSLWMRDEMFEIVDTTPERTGDIEPKDYVAYDVGRTEGDGEEEE